MGWASGAPENGGSVESMYFQLQLTLALLALGILGGHCDNEALALADKQVRMLCTRGKKVRGGSSSHLIDTFDNRAGGCLRRSPDNTYTPAAHYQVNSLFLSAQLTMVGAISLDDQKEWDDSALIASWDAAVSEYEVSYSPTIRLPER